MNKPIIGVIPLYDEEKESIWMLPGYLDGIKAAGGIPIVLPMDIDEDELAELDKNIAGYLFTGGHDVSPKLYNEKKQPYCGNPCDERDMIEKMVYTFADKKDKPILGICRGIQFINVMRGGTLYQDITKEYKTKNAAQHHMSAPYDRTVHNVNILKNSPLFSLLSIEEMDVNSYHHQAVKEVGNGLNIMAESEDGLVEGIYVPDKKFQWAVQWHPEFIFKKDERQLTIFKAFIDACR